jgi:hypothetical protein
MMEIDIKLLLDQQKIDKFIQIGMPVLMEELKDINIVIGEEVWANRIVFVCSVE